jgi:hypothetical protein
MSESLKELNGLKRLNGPKVAVTPFNPLTFLTSLTI